MSLIDEALKRAREEAALQEAAKRSGASRWAPSHIPGRRASAWKAPAALAAVFLAGCGAAWIILGRRERPAPPAAASPSIAVPAPSGAPPARSAEPPRVAPGTEPPKPERPARSSPSSRPPVPRAAAADRAAAEAPKESPAGAAARPAEPPPSRTTFVRTATLAGGETIELGGIVYSDASPVAILNGKVVGPGAVVGSYTVVRILEERVDLEGNGAAFSILLR